MDIGESFISLEVGFLTTPAMIRIKCILFFYLLVFTHSYSQEYKNSIDSNQINRLITTGIQYLQNSQRKNTSDTVGNVYLKGEWPSKMGLRTGYFLLGNEAPVDDSNCFTVASIHNALSEIYLLNPKYKCIVPMLDLSYQRILFYKNGNGFNFWNNFQPYRKLKRNDVIGEQELIRRPSNFRLNTRYMNKAANIVNDADDTALSIIAIKLYSKIKGDSSTLISNLNSYSTIFFQYQDAGRNNRHWYNYINGNDKNTGAFLTWLAPEYQFKKWNMLKVTGHNLSFFLPFSECYPHAYQAYLPYGSNGVDGVVNANILSSLAILEVDTDKKTQSAIKYINHKSTLGKYDRVGIYYPNRYQFPYATSKAYLNGIEGLEIAKNNMIHFLQKMQNKDGSWSARKIVNNKDQIQSTAFAINALINFDGLQDKNIRLRIERGIKYLLFRAISECEETHWEGGVFFSGGTVIRNTLFWKSDAYTTAIILNALVKYQAYFN